MTRIAQHRGTADVADAHPSECTFLLLELEYSVRQLRFQIDALAPTERERAGPIVDGLTSMEARRLVEYGRLLRAHVSAHDGESFETLRSRTIELLRPLGSQWPESVAALARDQVREDRRQVTRVALLRTSSI